MLVAIMQGARLNQVGKYMLAIMADPSWQIRASGGGMTLVIKAQEVVFSTIGNVHSTPLNDKSQVVLELVSPINL